MKKQTDKQCNSSVTERTRTHFIALSCYATNSVFTTFPTEHTVIRKHLQHIKIALKSHKVLKVVCAKSLLAKVDRLQQKEKKTVCTSSKQNVLFVLCKQNDSGQEKKNSRDFCESYNVLYLLYSDKK